jgi:hypothetical protein
MKRNLKQITLIFLVLAMVFSISTALVSCNTGSGTTGGLVIPGIGTSGTTAGSDGTQDGTQGTTAATTTAVTPPANEGDYINPLTGLKTTYDATGLKPIAVVVDNVNLAYAHQTGLTQADIMYETLIAPGISRLTILISDYNKLTPICNIRSAQLEHLDIIGSHNAIMVAHGGSTHEDFAAVAAARLGGGWNETFKQNTFGYINTLVDVGFTAEGGAKFGTIKYYSKTYAAFVEGQINKDIKDEAKKLKTVTVKDALRHPNWDMGAKITIDSATMLNKAFEIIEAHWLFDIEANRIEAVVHPQSIIHSMVEFVDGAVKAQLGLPDMHLPIRYALGDATRLTTNEPSLTLADYTNLTFEAPDTDRFPGINLSYYALEKGGNSACVINAANEIAVAAFLHEQIGFLDIYKIILQSLEAMPFIASPSYEDYVNTNSATRTFASSLVKQIKF